ncbi:MAG: N-acetyl-gamma-glutamyl-phosphate reductase, partial [Pseudomonadota bacterium]
MKRIIIAGASGYTGADMVRLALRHPQMRIAGLCANSHAGKALKAIYPHFHGVDLPPLERIEAQDWREVDYAFLCLPHGVSNRLAGTIPDHVRIIDLAADFRLRDPALWRSWYGSELAFSKRREQAVYGLSEWNADAIARARLVACPGCYPTAILLGLIPLVMHHIVDLHSIIIDAKSGVSGAGRSLKQANLFCEVAEGIHPYNIGRHRHIPEIEQELADRALQPVAISFTPHLVPMNRGELVTIYLTLAQHHSAD